MKRILYILLIALCWFAIGLRWHKMNGNLAMAVPAPMEDEYTETIDWDESMPVFVASDLPLPTEGEVTGIDLTLVTQWPTLASLKPRHNASKTRKR